MPILAESDAVLLCHSLKMSLSFNFTAGSPTPGQVGAPFSDMLAHLCRILTAELNLVPLVFGQLTSYPFGTVTFRYLDRSPDQTRHLA